MQSDLNDDNVVLPSSVALHVCTDKDGNDVLCKSKEVCIDALPITVIKNHILNHLLEIMLDPLLMMIQVILVIRIVLNDRLFEYAFSFLFDQSVCETLVEVCVCSSWLS